MHVPVAHSIEHLAGEREIGAASVHEREVGLKGDMRKEAMSQDLGVGLLASTQRR